jgi:hypothetical protein
VPDPEPSAGERVDCRAVGGAVVGEDPLDLDAVAAVVVACSLQEGGGGRAFLVGEYFGVGEAAKVVDGDVDVLPPNGLTVAACGVAFLWVVVQTDAA